MPKKGEKYKCQECGIVLIVEEPCGCAESHLVCCSVPMEKVEEKK